MSDDIPSLAEALAEIRRLRTRGRDLETVIDGMAELNEVLRARILELEAAQAVTLGTLEKPTPDEPARFTLDVPPSAPPHNE